MLIGSRVETMRTRLPSLTLPDKSWLGVSHDHTTTLSVFGWNIMRIGSARSYQHSGSA